MSIQFSNYGQERERIATEAELEIFERLCSLSGADLELVRKCDDYVSAVLGDWDFARIKYTPRAKWIIFPSAESGSKKHRIESPDDVSTFGSLIEQSLEMIKKFE